MTWQARTTTYADRAAWLAARTTGLGASEAAALLGCSPFAGPWDVVANKRDGAEIPEEPANEYDTGADLNDPKVRGTVLEPLVGVAYTAVTTRPHWPIGDYLGVPGSIAITEHAAHPWLRASLDAIVRDPDLGDGCGEWKTALHPWKWGTDGTVITGPSDPAWAVAVPEHICVQASIQMAVTELPFADVAVMTAGFRFRCFRFLRDERSERGLIRVLERLWSRYLVDGATPDLDESEACVRAMRARLAEDRTASRRADPDEAEAIAVLLAKREAEEAANKARAFILSRMGDCARLTLPAGPRGEPHGVRVDKRGTVTAF